MNFYPPWAMPAGDFLLYRILRLLYNKKPPAGCAPRGDEVYASHTARARRMRKAHSFLLNTKEKCVIVYFPAEKICYNERNSERVNMQI